MPRTRQTRAAELHNFAAKAGSGAIYERNKSYSPAIRHARFCVGNTRFDLHIYFSPHLPADTDGEQSFVTIHNHFFNEIIFAEKGGLEVQAGERRLTLQQGDIIVFKKGFLCTLCCRTPTRAFFLSDLLLKKTPRRAGRKAPFPCLPKPSAQSIRYTASRGFRRALPKLQGGLEEPAQFSYYAVIAWRNCFLSTPPSCMPPPAADAASRQATSNRRTELHGAIPHADAARTFAPAVHDERRRLERIA